MEYAIIIILIWIAIWQLLWGIQICSNQRFIISKLDDL